jgi:propanol-preferring alcohol dehydrogenase
VESVSLILTQRAIPIRPEVQVFKLEEANKALLELKTNKIRGAKVLTI